MHRAVAREQVVPAALELAGSIAEAAPRAVRGTKQALARSLDADLASQLAFEADQQSLDYETADLAEGLAAARERRPPTFRGE